MNSKIKLLFDVFFGEGPLPGLLSSRCIFTWGTGKTLLSPPLLMRELISSLGLYPHDLIIKQPPSKGPPPKTTTLWVMASTYKLCGDTNIQPLTLPSGAYEKAMEPHSSTLAWKIPWTEEPGRLQSMGSLRVGHDWATSFWLFTFMHWRRKWQPTPVFLPRESQGWGSLVGCRLCGGTKSDTTEAT